MGLMLGLNILDVLVFSGSVLKLIAKKIRKGLIKCLVHQVFGPDSPETRFGDLRGDGWTLNRV